MVDTYTFDSKQPLPAQTQYFSVVAQVDNKTAYKTAIAVDILRKYYKQIRESGASDKLLIVNGYSSKVSLDAILLGLWYMFSAFYGEYPDPLLGTIDGVHIGWNGPVDNPTVDIPLAHSLFDSLYSPSYSMTDKNSKLEAFSKYFYVDGAQLMGDYSSYNDLQSLDPDFYNYIDGIVQQFKSDVDSIQDSIIIQTRRWLFDTLPYALFYDSEYQTSNKYELLKSIYIDATKEITNLTSTIEQDIYNFTRKVYPLSYYMYVAYLYRYYIETIVNYVKPYHATHIYTPASVLLGRDNINSVTINEDYKRIIIKNLVDDIIIYTFDGYELPDYDISKRIKEYRVLQFSRCLRTAYPQDIYRTDIDTVDSYYYKKTVFVLDVLDSQLEYRQFNIASDEAHQSYTNDRVLHEACRIYNNYLRTIIITSNGINAWQNYVPAGINTIVYCDNETIYCDSENVYCDCEAGSGSSFHCDDEVVTCDNETIYCDSGFIGYDLLAPNYRISYDSVINTELQKLDWYIDHVENNTSDTIILLSKEKYYILDDIYSVTAECSSDVRFAFVFNIDSNWWYWWNHQWWCDKYNEPLNVSKWPSKDELHFIDFSQIQYKGFVKIVVAIPPNHKFTSLSIRYYDKQKLYEAV